MEHQTSTTLLQTKRRVTRYQCKLVRRILPVMASDLCELLEQTLISKQFLDLPAEIRNMIYDLVLGYGGIEAYFDELHGYLMRPRTERRGQGPPLPHKRTPALLVLNKQIYAEASYMLMKRGITFHHGLLTARDTTRVVSPHLLRHISSIHITDDGHPIIKGRILPESWNGYMRLLKDLGKILAKGHNLKNLTIRFGDDRLQEHMTECVSTRHDCGFRDQMRDAINSLRRVHNVKKVTLIGIIPDQARAMQDRMQNPAIGFGDLPRELRDLIYEQAVDWPDISKSIIRAMANWPDHVVRFPYPRRRITPTALLLNKQFSAEALQALRKKPLNILLPCDHRITDQEKVPMLTRLISRQALKNVESITIRMESWEWVYTIERSFALALATSPYLKRFRLEYKDTLKPSFLSSVHYPDNKLHLCLRELKRIRGLESATFEGDLPLCYADPLSKIMTSPRYTREPLPELKAINELGDMLIIDDSKEDESRRHQPISAAYLPEATTLN